MNRLLVSLALAVAAAACQVSAWRHLAPQWQSKRAAVTWKLPRLEFFTLRGWRYQLLSAALWLVGVILLLALVGA